jgi:S-formylglutathione hydrolase FrmB
MTLRATAARCPQFLPVRLSCWLLFLATWAPADDRISYHEIESRALSRRLPVAVASPTQSGRADGKAVLFFLHGRGRHHRSLLESAAAREALLTAPFFVVLPQGEDGWYINSPARPEDRYEAYLEEVVAWAQANLPIARSPSRRGIAGWSMGGYGAVRFAQTHPGQFGFVASIIGLLDFPRAEDLPEGQNYRVPTQRFTADPAIWAAFNPLRAVEKLQEARVTLVLATSGFERTMNENFLRALGKEALTARVHWLEGKHEFPVVERAVPIVLADAAEYFGEATP